MKHGIGKYLCDQCPFAAPTPFKINEHKAKHGHFPCDKCDYVATLKSDLLKHTRYVHMDRKYPCKYCDYTATRADLLRVHSTAMHEGTKFPCTMCDYEAKRQNDLNKHMKICKNREDKPVAMPLMH